MGAGIAQWSYLPGICLSEIYAWQWATGFLFVIMTMLLMLIKLLVKMSRVKGTSLTKTGRKEMFYLTTHSTHFIYGYMASDIWLRTIQIARKETHCRHMSNSFQLAARVLLYTPSHRQDSTYLSLCYTSRGALAAMRNSSMGSHWRIDLMTHCTVSERSYHKMCWVRR